MPVGFLIQYWETLLHVSTESALSTPQVGCIGYKTYCSANRQLNDWQFLFICSAKYPSCEIQATQYVRQYFTDIVDPRRRWRLAARTGGGGAAMGGATASVLRRAQTMAGRRPCPAAPSHGHGRTARFDPKAEGGFWTGGFGAIHRAFSFYASFRFATAPRAAMAVPSRAGSSARAEAGRASPFPLTHRVICEHTLAKGFRGAWHGKFDQRKLR